MSWNPTKSRELTLKLQFVIPKKQAPGPFVAARVALRWPDGKEETIDVRVNVAPLPAGVSAKDMETELIPVPRAVAPGGVVKLMYTIFSYEDTDQRVRLRVDAAPGWQLLDPEVAEREILVEAWEVVEGELYLTVAEDAKIGDRQLIRLLAEVAGEPGYIEAQNYVSVARRGGAKPGIPTVTGTSTLGLSRLGAAGLNGAQKAGALTFSSKFGPQSNFSFSYDQGLSENLSNFRYEEARTRASGNLRHAGWDVTFGNYVSAQGNALTGPYVRGKGASVRRPAGRLLSELTVAQPNTIGGRAEGHLVRGRVGLRTPTVTFALAASDFGRPTGGYTTLSSVQTTLLDATTEERLEYERRLTASAASNRVQGLGLDTEFRPAHAHRFTLSTGGLWLANAGTRVTAPVGEASYSLSAKRATLNTRWRETPPTVSGISIPGDELAADVSLSVARDARVVASVYQNSSDTMESDLHSRGEGGSLGLRISRGLRRLEIRGNYRESQYSTTTLRRSVSLLGGLPIGPFAFSGNADIGEQDSGARTDRVAFYRGDLRWVRDAGTVSFGLSHSEGGAPRRQRADLLLSLKVRDLELAGGAWATRGYLVGGKPGMWTSVGVPLADTITVTMGVDYAPLNWIDKPSWRGMFAVRQGFAVPLPFVRGAAGH